MISITLLEKDRFVSLTELEKWNCGLTTIELGALNGLTNLTELSMQDNKINDILPGTFENMSILVLLDLYNNKMKHLDRDLFRWLRAFNVLTKLRRLSLQCNKISDIVPGTFGNLSSLLYLNSSYNRIEHLDSAVLRGMGSFNGLPKVSEQTMFSNKIIHTMPGTFGNMSSLQYLDLSYNRIKHLVRALFRVWRPFNGLTNLTYLSMQGNIICEILPGTFQNMRSGISSIR